MKRWLHLKRRLVGNGVRKGRKDLKIFSLITNQEGSPVYAESGESSSDDSKGNGKFNFWWDSAYCIMQLYWNIKLFKGDGDAVHASDYAKELGEGGSGAQEGGMFLVPVPEQLAIGNFSPILFNFYSLISWWWAENPSPSEIHKGEKTLCQDLVLKVRFEHPCRMNCYLPGFELVVVFSCGCNI